jgi:hypothetical protein
MTTATDVNKMDAIRVDIPFNEIDANHYLRGEYNKDTDNLLAAKVVTEKTVPANASGRYYQNIDDMPLIDLVKHHFEGWNNQGVSFWLDRNTGGIIDCTALETGKSTATG